MKLRIKRVFEISYSAQTLFLIRCFLPLARPSLLPMGAKHIKPLLKLVKFTGGSIEKIRSFTKQKKNKLYSESLLVTNRCSIQ